MSKSFIMPLPPDPTPSRCGYCGSPSGPSSISTGTWAHHLTVHDYQTMIDRGWRRSGQYCYIPDVRSTCCPAYTIRLDVQAFAPSRGQRRVVRRWKAWIGEGRGRGGVGGGNEVAGDAEGEGVDGSMEVDRAGGAVEEDIAVREMAEAAAAEGGGIVLDGGVAAGAGGGGRAAAAENSVAAASVGPPAAAKRPAAGKTPWVKPDKGASRKPSGPDLAQLIDEAEKTTKPGGHRLEVKLVPAAFEEETYALFERYQTVIHKEPPSKVTQKGFKGFLVDTPLLAEPRSTTDPPSFPGYGSFHQKYYIDGRLAIVAVIDILPSCVSSVYLMYDPVPEVLHLSPGVYSALREIRLTQDLARALPSLKYYYMGYYIHSCPKMVYKAQFRPSELACRETFKWVSVDKCVTLLDQHKIARFSAAEGGDQGRPAVGPNAIALRNTANVSPAELQSLTCYIKGRLYLLKDCARRIPRAKFEGIKELFVLMGSDLLSNIILVIE
ncbi:arginine-tRNA-protein transferase [Zopfochytrium polystomum]|nr:arginine-tRNA-protein transferase [Zopfochytrium polystomum]